jgi:benzoate-CoA ligase
MPELSTADHTATPPRVNIPRGYNAAHDLIERNRGRAGKVAFIDASGSTTYGELAASVDRAANALRALGLKREDRVMLALLDTVAFPIVFLGAIKAGIVPIAANTLLTGPDFEFMLRDSRATALVVSAPLLPIFAPLLAQLPELRHVIVSGGPGGAGQHNLEALLAAAPAEFAAADTSADDPCFWLYSSGSTGTPKGTVHLHSHLILTAELYARPVLGIREDDVVFSAAKLFFAYGLGNGLTFPMSVGATAILFNGRPTPDAVFDILTRHRPTIFYGVPTLYAGMLAHPALPKRSALALRVCTSAGEALPADIGKRFNEHFGVEILDGIGSTEMLHIFISNRPGEVRYGTTGLPVPGYDIRLVDEKGAPAAVGEIGEMQVAGPTAALYYWNNRERTKNTFLGPWTRSGDKYIRDADGYYTYCGRNDDMLKVGGIYVSPFEVEAALQTHPAVLEAAVVGKDDEEHLTKPKAYVVLKAGQEASAADLQAYVKSKLAPYKYPRWVEFVDELPKTATGKIQRFKLRSR